MAAEPKSKAITKKARRRKPTEEIVDYAVEIEDWDWSYWLALNTLRDPPNPYHEHRQDAAADRTEDRPGRGVALSDDKSVGGATEGA